jgi:hypothetical protein
LTGPTWLGRPGWLWLLCPSASPSPPVSDRGARWRGELTQQKWMLKNSILLPNPRIFANSDVVDVDVDDEVVLVSDLVPRGAGRDHHVAELGPGCLVLVPSCSVGIPLAAAGGFTRARSWSRG